MNDAQLNIVVELISGTQAALVMLIDALHDKGVLHKQDARAYLDPGNLPPELRDGMVGLVFRQLQAGIDSSENSADRAQRLRQLFRVIDGSRPGSVDTTQPTDGS